jgi:hypothetical protein
MTVTRRGPMSSREELDDGVTVYSERKQVGHPLPSGLSLAAAVRNEKLVLTRRMAEKAMNLIKYGGGPVEIAFGGVTEERDRERPGVVYLEAKLLTRKGLRKPTEGIR